MSGVKFTAAERAELRDAFARSRIEAQEEMKRLAKVRVEHKALEQKAKRPRKPRESANVPSPPMEMVAAGDEALLALPEAQPVIARIAASVDPDYGDRAAHIKRVATLAIRAKLTPTNNYARPTLFIARPTTTGPDAERTTQRVGAS